MSGREAARARAAALLVAAREALGDAELLAGGARAGGAALRAADAALAGARAHLALAGLDPGDDGPAVALLFDRQVVAAGTVSHGCGLALHRALRAAREVRLFGSAAVYPARLQAVLEGVRQLLSESEIVLATS
ncbi:MAG: hypothetical protein KatS3mg102_2895 [Planctomycetota bacterium]|nr:MAG: hypothetical protein KatS3mg102_2895 [Planctomycetota bacterium]